MEQSSGDFIQKPENKEEKGSQYPDE